MHGIQDVLQSEITYILLQVHLLVGNLLKRRRMSGIIHKPTVPNALAREYYQSNILLLQGFPNLLFYVTQGLFRRFLVCIRMRVFYVMRCLNSEENH